MDQFQPPSVPPGPASQPQDGEPDQPDQPTPYGQPQPPAPNGQPLPPFGQPQPYPAPEQPQQYGQPPQQSHGQPQYPAYPGSYAAPQVAVVERPQSIRIAVLLMYIGAALALIGGIFSLFTVEAGIQASLNQTSVQLSEREYEAAASLARGLAYAAAIFGMVVGTGLWIWMALANNAGRKWARIVATVFAAIGIIGGIVSLISSAASRSLIAGSMILGILTLLVSIAALVYLWLRPSTEYYNFKSQKITY